MNYSIPESHAQSRGSVPPISGTSQTSPHGTTVQMSAIPVQPPGLNVGDIYYTLFRHKWKILLCTLAGFAAAAAFSVFNAPPYQSEAKLFVRYVISENKALGESAHKSPDQRGETIMKSEVEILSSGDLAKYVVQAVGAEKILASFGGGANPNHALAVVSSSLRVSVVPSTSVIHVVFTHPDPELVQPVLREVVNRYRKLHVETHTANGLIGDVLTQETDQLRTRLSHTEEELRKATLKAGIVSLDDAKKAYSDQLTALRRALFEAQAEHAQRAAVLEELKRRFPTQSPTEQAEILIPSEVHTQFQGALQQVQLLQQTERELLTQFTPENARVKEIRQLLALANETRNVLLAEYPKLAHFVNFGGVAQRNPETAPLDPAFVATQVTALEARIKVIGQQLETVHADAARVEQMEGTIVELRRKKDLEEASYRNYAASLEQSRINETLGSGRVSNISEIQSPTPPFSDRTKLNKILGLMLGGGLVLGFGWAFAIELYFDRTIKRAVDVERSVRVPLFLTIPALRRKQLKAASMLLNPPTEKNGSAATNGHAGANGRNGHTTADLSASDPLQPFHETLRDRLIAYFESVNLTHKPKLVALTSLRHQAGVTTTAAGLARSLSETGEGNVLLVDMTQGQGVARQFLKGEAVSGLDDLLQNRDSARRDNNLFLVTGSNQSERLSRNLPQRFIKLVPKLKASDFDYIIFDMPAVSQISITPRLANFMDMVLMIVESEKTDRDLVQRATTLLSESRAHVGVILNKAKQYVPARLHHDHLATC